MKASPTLEAAISSFGATLARKLANPAVAGEPEDQLRAPFEALLRDLAAVLGMERACVTAIGESRVADLKTRPDYAVTAHDVLVGFVELKAPGKGADPRRFREAHDKEQWARLRSLPNLLYTDGNAFMLWRDGEPIGTEVRLVGDLLDAGSKLAAPPTLLPLIESFLQWEPIPPRSAKELAIVAARLCRLLRDEVSEQLERGNPAFTDLATDWRALLFPEATNETFADGYAQAVTFGMLMARAREIDLSKGLEVVGRELGKTNSLIGAALRLLTDDAESQAAINTSLGTLTRVLDAVHWTEVGKGEPEAWLYFYEAFLEVYDNDLRKKTGSYYTPPEVVAAMTRLIDEVLRSQRFAQHTGLASPRVTLADPATGTGTFLLGVLQRIAATVEAEEGEGAVGPAIDAALERLIAFELQLGPFAVAQLRVHAEIATLTGAESRSLPRMFVTDTLGNPWQEEQYFPRIAAPIADSRKQANRIKREVPITVVIGNPPYKEKAKGRGGWIESGDPKGGHGAPLLDWIPPKGWGVGAHAKHLRNLYVYFWRWATWKVFDHGPGDGRGIVCFITVAGFLTGPGFERMRDYLRRTCDDVWVIDCSPEGHQPDVATRIFQGVQQPVCIVLASRSAQNDADVPAKVRFRELAAGHRTAKFVELAQITLTDGGWTECSTEWRAPFRPASRTAWGAFPALTDLFAYSGSGVMPGRTWVIAPDADSLRRRWATLVSAPAAEKERLFHPHLRGGELGDKHSAKLVHEGLPRFPTPTASVADDRGPCAEPVEYGYRSFDRQWLIPDSRLINQPNPTLWDSRSDRQVYMTALVRQAPTSGPALTITALIPDHDHYKGSFAGRVFPLWRDRAATTSNVLPGLLAHWASRLAIPVAPEDVVAYVAAIAAHTGYVARFRDDFTTPGLRIPLTADRALFAEAVELGRTVIWLHTFGERMADAANGRPPGPPRVAGGKGPRIPKEGAIPTTAASMPDSLRYDASKRRLLAGTGYVENVDPAVWAYEVSGKQVLVQWFSYRRANRERPIIGDRRPPSPLGEIQPDHWLPEYTTELLNVLNVLALLVELERPQRELLDQLCRGPLLAEAQLREAGAFQVVASPRARRRRVDHPSLFQDDEA